MAITNTSVGGVGRYTDVGRITLAVGTQEMDSNTCSDEGGNTNFNFSDNPIQEEASYAEQIARSIS